MRMSEMNVDECLVDPDQIVAGVESLVQIPDILGIHGEEGN
jgi:hypothetical protein